MPDLDFSWHIEPGGDFLDSEIFLILVGSSWWPGHVTSPPVYTCRRGWKDMTMSLVIIHVAIYIDFCSQAPLTLGFQLQLCRGGAWKEAAQ